MKLLYLHGFASCGDSNKTRALKAHFGDTHVLAPDLPVEPKEAIALAGELIRTENVTGLLGSSLGGFYATWLSCRYRLPAVLINPSVTPWRTLESYVGNNKFWCSGETFEWKEIYLKQLRRYAVTSPSKKSRLLVLLQSGDEVLDYRWAKSHYKGAEIIVEEGGNHRFENLPDYFGRIETFFV